MNKLVRACIALAAFAAFAVVPATASAENDATVVNGVHATEALGNRITGTSHPDTYSRLTNESGEELVRCTTQEISGTLVRNDHTAIEATIDRARFEGRVSETHNGHCSGSLGPVLITANPPTNGLHWCLQSFASDATDTFRVRGGACTAAARPIRFAIHITSIFGSITAEYERATAITGTVHTGTTPVLTVTQSEFVEKTGTIAPNIVKLDLRQQLHTETSNSLLHELGVVNAT